MRPPFFYIILTINSIICLPTVKEIREYCDKWREEKLAFCYLTNNVSVLIDVEYSQIKERYPRFRFMAAMKMDIRNHSNIHQMMVTLELASTGANITCGVDSSVSYDGLESSSKESSEEKDDKVVDIVGDVYNEELRCRFEINTDKFFIGRIAFSTSYPPVISFYYREAECGSGELCTLKYTSDQIKLDKWNDFLVSRRFRHLICMSQVTVDCIGLRRNTITHSCFLNDSCDVFTFIHKHYPTTVYIKMKSNNSWASMGFSKNQKMEHNLVFENPIDAQLLFDFIFM